MPLLIALPAGGHAGPWEAQSEEEALFLRRIADFWEEGEYQIVKGQIEEFLWEYPESSFAETLHATLGDLYIREKNFKGALMQYTRITTPELVNRVFLNRMQCLLELQWFATLADECEVLLLNQDLEPNQKFRATYLLAIALYQQCLNSSKDSDSLEKLAKRAQPHFKTLLDSELSSEIAQAFAHLSCILKDYESASKIYLHLADLKGSNREEMLFQAALLQAEYDKPLAIQTFHEILELGQTRSRDALYNQIVLTFDCGHYKELVNQKEKYLSQVSLDRREALHLLFGRSHLQLQQYGEALKELLLYAESAEPSDILRSALVDILEASYRLKDEPTLNKALKRFAELFPNDKQIPKGILGHAILLKDNEKWEEARQELEIVRTQYPQCPEIELALYEEVQLESDLKRWENCRALCREFLKNYPASDRAGYVWRYLGSSSSRLAAEGTGSLLKEQLARDLESMLLQQTPLSDQELKDWSFLLAKTNYELQCYEEAISLLEPLLAKKSHFAQEANSHLLLALCYRDGIGDLEKFCTLSEKALSLRADLLDQSSIHIALFNGYLSRQDDASIESAADHLYAAARLGAVQPENLLWLADYYYDQSLNLGQKSALSSERAAEALEKFLATTGINLQELDEQALSFEGAFVKLAELCGRIGQPERQQELLESLKKQQELHADWAWKEENKVDLLLAECYANRGKLDQAIQLFDRVVAKSPTVRSFASASASLQSARLRLSQWTNEQLSPTNPESTKVLAQLKNLILQKTLANEPVHLEAAIEYVDLQTQMEEPAARTEKRLALLSKSKADFEMSDDLLSRDYQSSRKALSGKDRIYRAYLSFLDAEIFLCRAALSLDDSERALLKESAQSLYQEILRDPVTPFLETRVRQQLESTQGQ